jgi:hypothetical protein
MVEIHQALANVPIDNQSCQVDDDQGHKRIEEYFGSLQNMERMVAQESNVQVVADGH